MTAIGRSAISRRSLLVGAASATIAASLPGTAESSQTAAEFRLVAAPARWPMVGKSYPDTDAWCYDGRVPGPEIRLRQGKPVRITVENGLADDTTVHWHGIRLPIAMDGVPGLTQAPIRPGESFTYEFTPPDAGTFWYHPHANSLQQLGRGMAGALIVEELEAVPVDRDILWLLSDWRLTSDAQIASGFGNPMEAAMSGRHYRVVDDFYDGLSYWLTQLAYEDKPPLRAHPLEGSLALARNPLPEPDLAAAGRHALALQGGMMGGGGMGMGMQGREHEATCAINGHSMTGDGHAGMAPLLTLQLGRSYVLAIRNETAFWHPVHFHGHSFRVLSRNGSPVPHRQWADTVLLPPKETVDVAFVADNPGDWMLHCHVTDHQVSGLMTVLRVA